MEEIKKIQTFFEGLIDYFFDPCQTDEGQQEVISLIQNSKMNQRLGHQLLPDNPMQFLCSSGWNYKDYAEAIKTAAEEWKTKTEIREGQFY